MRSRKTTRLFSPTSIESQEESTILRLRDVTTVPPPGVAFEQPRNIITFIKKGDQSEATNQVQGSRKLMFKNYFGNSR